MCERWKFFSLTEHPFQLSGFFFFSERHKLLTKKVCETPHHKQGSSRFLFRQKMGRYVQQQLNLLRLTDLLFILHITSYMSQKSEF